LQSFVSTIDSLEIIKYYLFSILGTGESAIYANIILKKGVIAKKPSKNENDDGAE
jgi:L-fucose mutarotase/ribose pyranase (RbsD/FucU family)